MIIVENKNQFLADIFALTKPRISLMTLLVAFAGIAHADSDKNFSILSLFLTMLAIYLLVGGANSLNMAIEYEQDALMSRTKNRPIAAKRLSPLVGFIVGFSLSLISLIIFYFFANPYTSYLAIIALMLYVMVYTPLKTYSCFSLIVGSIPGAMPVVLGYTAKSGMLDNKAIALFLWAFLWQIPHFLAISIFREEEYNKAGFIVMPKIFGLKFTKNMILLSSWLLVISTIALYLTGIICIASLICSLILGGWFLYISHQSFSNNDNNAWAKKTFKASLVYQSILFIVLLLESIVTA